MISRIQEFIADPINTLITLLCILIALSFHEFAHAWAAHKMGDDTAKMQGRLSIDPMKHLDPWGFISMLFFGFGWAKPVPINPNLFRKRRLGTILVSLAGITMNFLLALISILLYVFLVRFNINEYLINFLSTFSVLNIGLMVFNLLPIPPLDGYQALKELLLGHLNLNWLWQYERYGIFILLGLSLLGITGRIISPIIQFVFGALLSLAIKIFGFI